MLSCLPYNSTVIVVIYNDNNDDNQFMIILYIYTHTYMFEHIRYSLI